MAPTPPSAEAAQPGSANSSAPASATTPRGYDGHDGHDGHDERTRRNVACVNCRNSKVRCRTSPVPGRPCQRCAKLAISCVVDKTHKRVTKRSKLEQLEQELKSIRQVVQPTANGSTPAWTPPSPRAAVSALPDQRPSTAINQRVTPQVPTPQPESSISQVRSTQSSERRMKTAPTEARLLENHIVSGEDVDWYFTKYLQCFHPFMPILRIRDPDECFDACPTLFWIIVYVASRRYPRDRSLFPLLVDHLGKDIWLMASSPAMNYEGVHALLILCNWPLPTVRFVTDPSPTFGAMALQSAMFLGCHTGRGNHPDYHVGVRQHFLATDEEASATWLACCIAAQRTTAAAGLPPPTTQHSDVRPKAALESPAWTDVLAMHEVQRFLNRLHTAMYAQITANGGVTESSVAMWETDFESLKPLLIRYDTDISRFCMLATHLELQLYYFLPPTNIASPPPQSIKAHAVRIFNTSRAIIALSLDLESRTQFLTHATHWVLRTNVDATVMILAILHSASAPGMNEPDADLLIQQACGAVLRCSVRDADLPHRVSIIMDTFWSIRHLVPSIGQAPQGRVDRLAAGVTFWCLHRFRTSLQSAEKSTDRVNKALEIMQSRCTNNPHSAPPVNGQPQPPGTLNSDPIQDVDWSIFMDDFGWVGDENVLLGLPPNMNMPA